METLPAEPVANILMCLIRRAHPPVEERRTGCILTSLPSPFIPFPSLTAVIFSGRSGNRLAAEKGWGDLCNGAP